MCIRDRSPDAPKTSNETQEICKLTGGETVESGWTGKDTGSNSCNSCFCTNGALGCTKMACRALKANSNSKPSSTPQITPTSEPLAITNTPDVQHTDIPTSVPTATSVPTSFEWPNPPTGQAELMLSSTSGSVDDEVTAIGRGFTNTGYVVIWIDGDDDGQIDDWEYVFATDIKATERAFSHIFIVDSNFQGTSHINAMGGDGNAVNPAMNPTFNVSGPYATAVQHNATDPIAAAVPTL